MLRSNRLKARLRAKERSLCAWALLGSAHTAEIMALCGVDGIIIDHEHGPADLMSAIAIIHAVSATDATTVMRVPSHDPVYVKRALDAGIEGIMFPSVNSVEQARAAVAACHFPPAGKRGAAYTYVRASDYGLRAADYVAHSAAETLIIAQVESLSAVENLPEIAKVDGIDAFYIGPLDLSASIGKLGQAKDPEVAALLTRAETAVRETGKALCGSLGGGQTAADMFGRGYTMVGIGTDIDIVRNGAVAAVAAARIA
jgi:2-keto-3-deoxy-L-rhamnonate aldolase RhmA